MCAVHGWGKVAASVSHWTRAPKDRTANGKLWKLLKNINKEQPQAEQYNTTLSKDGKLVENDEQAADLLGLHYQKIIKLNFTVEDRNIKIRASRIIHGCRSDIQRGTSIFNRDFRVNELEAAIDDTSLNKSPGPGSIHEDIQNFAVDQKLRFNPTKSTVSFFTTNRKLYNFPPNIFLKDQPLTVDKHPKYLGLVLDPEILGNKHIDHIILKARKRLNTLRYILRRDWGEDTGIFRNTHISLIRPILEYGVPVYCRASSSLGHGFNRQEQTHLPHFRSAHLKTMKFSEGSKSFEMSTNCSSESASTAHILECLGQDLADDPLLGLEFLRGYEVPASQ
ncbi:putative RNA-directed DNA polymerase from transposon BS [Trichonephila clavipes]|uniref:Putative RNA-directed DNA polymerase from transposon BS n=1 Tax=Trichonephila clavipes TaxID=2585209 RepID=A0A8X6VDS7_TRICX|nr:putative RNA-directed DNA polymerase from transposon BS [Trichonephila clavipes]